MSHFAGNELHVYRVDSMHKEYFITKQILNLFMVEYQEYLLLFTILYSSLSAIAIPRFSPFNIFLH